MDDVVMIKDTNNLEELEKNYELYNSQSYNYRKIADDQSISFYGTDNHNRYNEIKARILQLEPEPDIAGSVANLKESGVDTTFDNYKEKVLEAIKAEQDNGVVMVYLNPTNEDTETKLQKLNAKYQEYFNQSEHFRSIADDFAYSIFNTDNQNMYFKLKGKLLEDKEGEVLDTLDSENVDQYRASINFEMTKYPFDTILSEAFSTDIDTIDDIEKKYNCRKDLNTALATDYSEEIPTIVPNMFPEELLDLGILNRDNFYKVADDISDDSFLSEYFHGIFMDPYKYKNLVEENYRKLKVDYNTYAQKLLELAWNPEVEPSKENYAKARRNMIKYINAKMESVNILNVSRYNADDTILSETTKFDNELFPVFVVCSYTYTAFGKLTRKVTNAQFSHAAIGFDSGLQTLYSFNMQTPKKHGGLSFESIDGYINVNNKAELFVGCVFLNKHDYERIRNNVNWYIANYDKCNYSIGNLFLILVNKAKTKKYQMNMVCSQFVDSLFKLVNIDITGKPSNLVKPEDLRDVADDSKVYIIFDGLAKDYSMSKADKKIKSLIHKIKTDKLTKDDVNKTMVNPTLAIVAESKDKSTINRNFKKKNGLHFETIDLYDSKALKYISKDWLKDNKVGEIIICVEDDKIAGYCLANKSGNIAPLRVYEKYRGYGLSETLMKDIINKYGGYKLGVYSDNKIALHLYKKLGFVEIGKKTYKDGDVVLIMQLKTKIKKENVNNIIVNPTLAIVAESSSYYSGLEITPFFENKYSKNVYYRITYNGEGIYQALKKEIGLEEWKKLLSSNKINWLPKPPNYPSNYRSYFTKEGYNKFNSSTLPIIYKYLDKDKVKIDQFYDINNIVYSDKYQVVTESSLFFEKTVPIKIDDKFITIDTPKDIETEYQKSHKLLIEYDKAGSTDQIRDEICKLWFMNTILEKKIHKPSCKDKEKLINLRSRILNDFKKYLKVILKEEPDFNFTDYFNNSPYSDTNIKMDKRTALELVDIIKQLVKQ